MRKRKWSIGQEYNGWTILSTEPHITPNGTKRYQCTVKCSKCGYQKTTTQPISKLSSSNCPHKSMGNKQPYERVYKYSGDGEILNSKLVVRLSGSMLKEIDDLSNKLGVSKPGVLRIALTKFIESHFGGKN